MKKISPATLELSQQALAEHWSWWGRLWNGSSAASLLEKVLACDEPAAIPYLMPLGLSSDARVRQIARKGIEKLYRLVRVEDLLELDHRLRSSWQSLHDWHALKPDALHGVELSSATDVIYVGLVASHRSGYVRAEALRLLREHAGAEAIPFVLVRLTDWVEPVRAQAMLCLEACLTPENAPAVVASLTLIEQLERSVRFFQAPRERIAAVLQESTAVTSLRAGMASPIRDLRRLCFRYASSNPGCDVDQVLEQAAADRDALIRRWAYTFGGTLRFVARAAADEYAPNRWLGFERLSQNAGTLRPFLFDRAGEIRRECQKLLSGRFGEDPALVYRQALDDEIAVLGLGETGGSADLPLVYACMGSRKARVRRAAVQALFTLDGAAHRETFLRVISTDTPSVAGQATWALLAERDRLVPAIWQAARANANARTRWSVLRLLREKWKWSLLAVYLDAAADPDLNVRGLAMQLLDLWVRRFEWSFLQPSSEERADLAELRKHGRVPAEWEAVVNRALV